MGISNDVKVWPPHSSLSLEASSGAVLFTFQITCFCRLESLKSNAGRLLGCSQLSHEIMRKMTRAWHSGQVTGSENGGQLQICGEIWIMKQWMTQTLIFNLLLIVLLLLNKKEYLVIDGLLRLERILNIFLNPRPLRDMSVGLTS